MCIIHKEIIIGMYPGFLPVSQKILQRLIAAPKHAS